MSVKGLALARTPGVTVVMRGAAEKAAGGDVGLLRTEAVAWHVRARLFLSLADALQIFMGKSPTD